MISIKAFPPKITLENIIPSLIVLVYYKMWKILSQKSICVITVFVTLGRLSIFYVSFLISNMGLINDSILCYHLRKCMWKNYKS